MADEEDDRNTHKRKSNLTPSSKKKRARISREKYLSKRPFIGDDNAQKWHELKGNRTDAEFATILLENYESRFVVFVLYTMKYYYVLRLYVFFKNYFVFCINKTSE